MYFPPFTTASTGTLSLKELSSVEPSAWNTPSGGKELRPDCARRPQRDRKRRRTARQEACEAKSRLLERRGSPRELFNAASEDSRASVWK